MNMVETNGLCKQYGSAIRVKQLRITVPEGAVYGFLGPNGAGKSTTLKMILGLVHATAGTISVLQIPVCLENRLSILKNVGSLIESPSYYGHLTGEENLRIIQTLRGIPSKHIQQVLEIVRLDGQKSKPVAHYSLGMKQRLGLACALLGFPKLLILDEPTNGLDPAGIQEMRELVCSLPKQYGITVLVSSHLLSEIDQMATVVGIIRQGELVFEGSLAALHAHSQQRLAIRTQNDALAEQLLQKQGIPFEVLENQLLLSPLADPEVARLVCLLAQGHAVPVRMEARSQSLEDIFLQLTGGKDASL